jgi:hypothetical protein
MKKPTWPDGTPKSMNNAFNWRDTEATAHTRVGTPNARSLDMHSNGNICVYTKATKVKGFVVPPPPRGNKMYTIKKQ